MKPPLVCENCRLRKKRCDRTYPICSYCLQTSHKCFYRVLHNNTTKHHASKRLKIDQQEEHPDLFAAARYLDSTTFQPDVSSSLRHAFALSAELHDMLRSEADLEDTVIQFWDRVDPWMPLIPKSYLLANCLRVQPNSRSSEQWLLLACIKLLTENFEADDANTKNYSIVKAAFTEVEALGVFSIPTAQARFLLLLYEFGHGIIPAAFISMRICMGYLEALRIETDPARTQNTLNWLVEEQIQRMWWAAYVLDRALRLGCIERPLQVTEPTRKRLLPSNEESWKQEHPSVDQATLSSPATAHMGNFRLLILAADLLGLALEYRADIDQRNANLADQVEQLYRTLLSFSKVLEVEEQADVSVGAARSIINSAIMTLYLDPRPLRPKISVKKSDQTLLLTPRGVSAKLFLDRTRIYMAGGLAKPEEAAPFLLHWGYQAFRFYYHAYYANQCDEYEKAVKDLINVFWVLNQKWKLASVYMRLVSNSQISQ